MVVDALPNHPDWIIAHERSSDSWICRCGGYVALIAHITARRALKLSVSTPDHNQGFDQEFTYDLLDDPTSIVDELKEAIPALIMEELL